RYESGRGSYGAGDKCCGRGTRAARGLWRLRGAKQASACPEGHCEEHIMTGPGQPPEYGDQWQQQGGWQYGQPPQQGGWQYGQPPQQGGWQYGQPPQQGGWQYGQPPQQAGWPGMYPHQGQGGYAPQPGTSQQPRHRGKRWIVVSVVVAVLVVVGGGGTWFAVSQ